MTAQEIVRAAGEQVMGWEFDEGSPVSMASDCWYDDSGTFMRLAEGWNPLTSLSDAGMLIDKMRERGFTFVCHSAKGGCMVNFCSMNAPSKSLRIYPTLAEAITVRALSACGVEVKA